MSAVHLTIVTGASRGLGRALAKRLLAQGHAVLSLSRSVDDAWTAQASLQGTSLTQWSVDLHDASTAALRLTQWLEEGGDEMPRSATLINNAGTIGQPGPLAGASGADLSRSLRVGLEAPLLLTAAFLNATRAWRCARRVLNISSGLGRVAIPSQAAYCAAKAGMDHFSRVLALEEASNANGAKVVSLAPGVIDTDMQGALRAIDAHTLPDSDRYRRMKDAGQLDSPGVAADKILAYLAREDFGAQVVADISRT